MDPLETPFEPRARGLWPRVRSHISAMTTREQLLWATAGVLAIAFLFLFFSTPNSSSAQRSPTPAVAALQVVSTSTPTPTHSPTPTPTPTLTPTTAPTHVPLQTLPPLEIPTPPAGGVLLNFSPDPKRSGWVGSKEPGPHHWGDLNLQTGVFQGQSFVGVMQFDLTSLAPGSRVLFAALQVTGQNSRYLQADGQWTLELIDSNGSGQWNEASYPVIEQAPSLAMVGKATAQELSTSLTKRFILSTNQLALVQKQLDIGKITFRLSGPADGKDNLFTWDMNKGPTSPTLYVVVVPAQFVEITATPKPANVFAAATLAMQQTLQAHQFGTPSPLSRAYVTVTPAAGSFVVITSVPGPANPAVASATAAYVTAVAATTGTFTPIPTNWITATPTPAFVALNQFTPIPTRTATLPRELSRLDLLKTPIPAGSGLNGEILFTTDREGSGTSQVYVMNPTGEVIGKLNGDQYYQIAENRTLFSPDESFQLDVGKNNNGLWQVVMIDFAKGLLTPLITESPSRTTGKGTYQPEWSPRGDKIVYVSDRERTEEIYVYDVSSKLSTRLTYTPLNQSTWEHAQNNHPSWSPDGKQIVFASNRDPFPLWQLWIMDADGSDMHVLSTSLYNDAAPEWLR